MKEALEKILKEALAEIKDAKAEQAKELEVKFLGKKSELMLVLRGLGALSKEEKPLMGKLANEVKVQIMDKLVEMNEAAVEAEMAALASAEWIDVTYDRENGERGHIHPISQLQKQLEDIFTAMGFEIADGDHIETEWYNFNALNVPDDHPSRDMQDTFWLSDKRLLRTHTSGMQVRYYESHKPPFRAIVPGKVFRYEQLDATHENTFNQLEGFIVDKDVSVANLIAVLKAFLSRILDKDMEIRLRPGYFPFVEPGYEVDIKCIFCDGKGCGVCKKTGWIELLGCGMIHPSVLEAGKIDPEEWRGLAFGMGVDRLAMLKYGINDIRVFNGGDLRELRQF